MRASRALQEVDGPRRDVVDHREQTGGATDAMTRMTVTAEVTELGDAVYAPAFGVSVRSFEEMVDRHQTEIYRYALRLTRNRADADDLCQETLLRAFRAADRLDAVANHRAWLYRIAANTFRSQRRRGRRETPLDEAIPASVPAETADQAAALDARDVLHDVEAFVANLPDKQRIALILRKVQNLDYGQIATRLDTSEGEARGNVYEALRKLRDAFADRL